MVQLEKNQRYTLIKVVSDIRSLHDVKKVILTNEKKEPFMFKGMKFNPDNEETYFLYRWNFKSKHEENLMVNLNGTNIEYLKATAQCEYSKRTKLGNDKKLLLKADRLNLQETDVLFMCVGNDVYAVIFSFDDYELRRVKKLIGNSNIEPLNSEYQITSDIFLWLFYKYISEDTSIGSYIEIQGITSFTGNVLTDENRFAGDSGTIPELIITKAFLANNYPITSIKVDLNVDDVSTAFYISQTSIANELRVMVLRGSETNILLDSGDIHDVMPIYIFCNIIPEIFEQYIEGKETFEKDNKDEFLSKLGIEVIKQILARNNLTIDDIK